MEESQRFLDMMEQELNRSDLSEFLTVDPHDLAIPIEPPGASQNQEFVNNSSFTSTELACQNQELPIINSQELPVLAIEPIADSSQKQGICKEEESNESSNSEDPEEPIEIDDQLTGKMFTFVRPRIGRHGFNPSV